MAKLLYTEKALAACRDRSRKNPQQDSKGTNIMKPKLRRAATSRTIKSTFCMKLKFYAEKTRAAICRPFYCLNLWDNVRARFARRMSRLLFDYRAAR